MLLVAVVNAGYGISLLIQLYQAFTSKVSTWLMMVAPQASSSLTTRRVYLVVALLCVITQGIIASGPPLARTAQTGLGACGV
mgnify:CR=1 FL=1